MLKLRFYREKLKLKQWEVANSLGIQLQTYENYELGKRKPNNKMLLKLADFFNVSLDDLFGRENSKFLNVTMLEPEQQNIINTALKLNRDNLIKVETYSFARLEEQNIKKQVN